MLLDIRNTNYTISESEVGSKTFRNSTVWEGTGSQFKETKSPSRLMIQCRTRNAMKYMFRYNFWTILTSWLVKYLH